jgi:hypothetical protein
VLEKKSVVRLLGHTVHVDQTRLIVSEQGHLHLKRFITWKFFYKKNSMYIGQLGCVSVCLSEAKFVFTISQISEKVEV